MAQESLIHKRTRYDIYAMLIRIIIIHGYCPLTRAARSTNLPVDRAKTTMAFLEERGLVEVVEEAGRNLFRVTVRGRQYLELYKRMISFVGMPMPEPVTPF
ncbi:MAG: winged helix-turn-helix domain-containing protein [Candidatus Thorarchaeota archaeon]